MQVSTILTVILNYRTPELTIKAAEAAVREMRDLGGEVVIVDNGSPDESHQTILREAVARGWLENGLVRVVQSPENRGFGAGNNFGINLGLSNGTKPDFVYILNSDAWPDPGAVRKLHDVLRQEPAAGMAGSYIKGTDGAPHCTAFRFPSIAGEFEGAARVGLITRLLKKSVVPMQLPSDTTAVDWVAGASLMIRTKMLDQVGGFDETFFLYFEETELCRRADAAGWKTYYVPSSEVVHVGSASTGLKTWSRTPGYWFDSRLYYFAKVHGRPYAVAATAARVAGSLIWGLRRLISDKPQADPPGFLGDLIAHSLKTVFKSGQQKRALRVAHPMTEDGK